ncbi:uncharacterized protein LOC107367964 [Tetranychus urticae]|nr:uncharacterized protein LOC107367964 [Tetranychus urticae]
MMRTIVNNFSGFITFLLHFCTIAKSIYLCIMSLICDMMVRKKIVMEHDKTVMEHEKTVMEPSQVSQKYWYLENVLKLEEEINRNIEIISKVAEAAEEDDDIRMVTSIELSKSKMLKKGKLKMFRDLCLVALKEIPPIEGDKEVTIDDLDGFWCLLSIESEKHRQSVTEILKPRSISDKEKVNIVNQSEQSQNKVNKAQCEPSILAEKQAARQAAIKVKKTNIDERNRKYMERMKKLKEKKAKPVLDKENFNPNQIS